MSTIEQYRAHAHDCLLRANSDGNDPDRPLWLTLAQSWLQLAEHADRVRGEHGTGTVGIDPEREDEETAA